MKEDDRRRAIQRRLARMEPTPAQSRLWTGIAVLDAALGENGIPRGGIVEIFGPPDSGKSTLALQIAAHAQRSGLAAGWVDADRAFDPAYAAALGVDVERVPIMRPDSAEQSMAMLEHLAKSRVLDLIVIDSAAALAPSLELELGVSDQEPGLQSRVMASSLRTLARVASTAAVTVIFLNHARIRKGPAGEDSETSAGGPALKLYTAIRIALSEAAGGRARFRILKNKAGRAFGAGELIRRAGPGFVESL